MRSKLFYNAKDAPDSGFIHVCKEELEISNLSLVEIVNFDSKILHNLRIILAMLWYRIWGYRCYVFQSRHAFKRIWSVDVIPLASRICLMRTYVDKRMANRKIAPSFIFAQSAACAKTLQKVSTVRHCVMVNKYRVTRVPLYISTPTPTKDVCYISQATENFLQDHYWDEASHWLYRNTNLIIKAMADLSIEHGKSVSVLMRPHANSHDSRQELAFFESIPAQLNLIRHDKETTFASLADHKLIVSAHSTLAIDAFSAGYPVSFFGDSECPSYDLSLHGIQQNICSTQSHIKKTVLRILNETF